MRYRSEAQRRMARTCVVVFLCNVGLLGLSPSAGSPLLAQSRSGDAPSKARALIVRVDSRFRDTVAGREQFRAQQIGAGIIIAVTDSLVYIATAGHVVHYGSMRLENLTVTFARLPRDSTSTTATATRLRSDTVLDLSILTIPRERGARVIAEAEKSLDRLGDSGRLRLAPVSPVGCPGGICWQIPVPADVAFGVDHEGIPFQSSYVDAGSSGGALFNAQWEVVGLVTKDQPPRANAIPIEWVVDRLKKQWRLPVGLRKHGIPRAGYRTLVSASLLMPIGDEQEFRDRDRPPSGRMVLSRQSSRYLRWHASLLRLAPRDLGVTAGLAGGSVSFQGHRGGLHLFGEVGMGRVEGRYDGGGVERLLEGGESEPVSVWQQAREVGFGAGAGFDAQYAVSRRTMVSGMIGYWNFSTPAEMPEKPRHFYVGLGLRFGLEP
jgi:hypothetical protein